MIRKPYILPRMTEFTSSDINSIAPLLMSGGCYSTCHSSCYSACHVSCYSTCYSSCYTAPAYYGDLYIVMNDKSLAAGHSAMAIKRPGLNLQLYNFGPWDNATAYDVDGAVSVICHNEHSVHTWADFSNLCENKQLRITNTRYAQSNTPPCFIEKFNKYKGFKLPDNDLRIIESFATNRKNNPGSYNLITRNCLMFVVDAIAQAGWSCYGYDERALTDFLNAPASWFSMLSHLKQANAQIGFSSSGLFYE